VAHRATPQPEQRRAATHPKRPLLRTHTRRCDREPGHFICCAIINGTLHLTTLPWRKASLGMLQYAVGFLLELYEATLTYRLPDVEFAIHSGGRRGTPGGAQASRSGQAGASSGVTADVLMLMLMLLAACAGDYPLVKLLGDKTSFGPSEPVFLSYSKTLNSPDILVPGSPNFRCVRARGGAGHLCCRSCQPVAAAPTGRWAGRVAAAHTPCARCAPTRCPGAWLRFNADSFDKVQLEVAQLRQQHKLVPWSSKQPVTFGRHSPFCIDFLCELLQGSLHAWAQGSCSATGCQACRTSDGRPWAAAAASPAPSSQPLLLPRPFLSAHPPHPTPQACQPHQP
jgi:hypothetical protein